MSNVEALAEVTCRVLEDCAFLFLESGAVEDCDVADALACSIAIDADGPHALKLVASRRLLVEAAANMLGTEADDPKAFRSAEQAISELLNVLAGSVVARLYGTSREHGLGLPQRADPRATPDDAVVIMLRADTGDFLRLELR